jgi:radical SAM superfamily enzyme YgiQ (UPF0313 family)
VLVGGHAAFNPEPLAPFIDAAVMGDGEEVVLEIDDVLRAAKRDGLDRAALLRALADVEGVYVPSLYEPRYTEDGRLSRTVPVAPGVPTLVPKRTVQDLEQWPYPQRQIVPMTETVHERFSVEIFRGCTRGCRFCQAGMITRPVRERRPETVQRLVEEGVADTGFEEVGLLSLSSADHSAIGPIARALGDTYEGTVTSLSLPSTRVDAFNVTLSNELTRNGRRSGLTFAPEAGSERMRAVINKMVSEEDLLRTAEVAFSQGWRHIKLYFMVGLPTETDEDVLAIADLGIAVYRIARAHGKANKVTLSVGGFVPKPHTPFQWAAQDTPEEIHRKLGLIRQRIRSHDGIRSAPTTPRRASSRASSPAATAGSPQRSSAPGSSVPASTAGTRCRRSTCGAARWTRRASTLAWYAQRERDEDEVLPWDHLDSGLEKGWLWEDWQDARTAVQLDDCRWSPCYDCGVCPGLDLVHDTGYQPGALLPVVPTAPATSAVRRALRPRSCRRAPSATRPPRPQHRGRRDERPLPGALDEGGPHTLRVGPRPVLDLGARDPSRGPPDRLLGGVHPARARLVPRRAPCRRRLHRRVRRAHLRGTDPCRRRSRTPVRRPP